MCYVPRKFQKALKSSTPGNLIKLCMLHPSEISRPKTQIPKYPCKFYILNHLLPPLSGFFQNSPISKTLCQLKHCRIRVKITYQLLVGFFRKLISFNAGRWAKYVTFTCTSTAAVTLISCASE